MKKLREYILGTEQKVPLPDGRLTTYINFDNAATTPPFKSVMEKLNEFAPWYSSIHRGKGYKSRLSSQLYEKSRDIIADFVNINRNKYCIVFTKNTTEAINKLSYRLCTDRKDKVILTTEMEHHSNDLPWRDKYTVDYISLDKRGRLSLSDLEAKLIKYKDRVELVTVTGISNVTGYLNPIHRIAAMAHTYESRIMVDGAQLVPHIPVNMKPVDPVEHIDFLAFSAHKMYAPFGTGVLIGPQDTFNNGCPEYPGGGTVDFVTRDDVIWDNPPHKEEAGTPNIMGVIALVEAIKTMQEIKMENIENQEKSLLQYTVNKIRKIPDIKLYVSYNDFKNNTAIIPFNIQGIHHELTARILANEAGVAVRNGCFCAQPYVQKILNIPDEDIDSHRNSSHQSRPGLVRISLGLYNTKEEIDILVQMLKKIVENSDYYLRKYAEQIPD